MQPVGEDEWDRSVSAADAAAVLFWADWCLPSRTAAEALERVAGGRLRAFSVDVDESRELARRLGIEGLPTLLLLVRGQERARRIGLVPADDLKRFLEGALTPAAQ